MSDGERGEGSGIFSFLLLLLALPLLVGVCSTGAYLAYRASATDAVAPPAITIPVATVARLRAKYAGGGVTAVVV